MSPPAGGRKQLHWCGRRFRALFPVRARACTFLPAEDAVGSLALLLRPRLDGQPVRILRRACHGATRAVSSRENQKKKNNTKKQTKQKCNEYKYEMFTHKIMVKHTPTHTNRGRLSPTERGKVREREVMSCSAISAESGRHGNETKDTKTQTNPSKVPAAEVVVRTDRRSARRSAASLGSNASPRVVHEKH